MTERSRPSNSSSHQPIDLTNSDDDNNNNTGKTVIDLLTPSPPPSTSNRRQPPAVEATSEASSSRAVPAIEADVPEASRSRVFPAGELSHDTSTVASPRATPGPLPKEVDANRHTPSPQIKPSPHSSKHKAIQMKPSPRSSTKENANIPQPDLTLGPSNYDKSTPEASSSPSSSSSSSEEEEIIPLSPSKHACQSPGTPSRSSTRSGKGSQKSTIGSSSPLIPRLKARGARTRQSSPQVEPGDTLPQDIPSGNASTEQPSQKDQPSQQDQPTTKYITESLQSLEQSMRDDHAMSTRWLLQDARESVQNTKTLAVDKVSPFASMSSVQLQPKEKVPSGCLSEHMDTWLVSKSNKLVKSKSVQIAKRISGDTPRVPRYSSHTNVSRNILSADSEKLKYVPYLGDAVGSANKETNFKRLLKELEEVYSLRRIESTRQYEKASRIRAYLEAWFGGSRLDCDQKILIHYMLTREDADKLGLREGERQLLLESFDEPLSEQNEAAGELFWEAFNEVFDIGLPNVLLPTELLKEMVESARKKAYHTSPEKSTVIPGDRLGTYATLTCLICGAVDCQTHADYTHEEIIPAGGSDDEEQEPEYLVQRQPLVLPYHDMIRRFDVRKSTQPEPDLSRRSGRGQNACSEQCWKVVDYSEREVVWKQNDLDALQEMLISITDKDYRACHIAFALDLPCWQIYSEISEHEVDDDTTKNIEEPTGRPKRPDWYDNKHDPYGPRCQNVCLQRGKLKACVIGESQLEGVGFGLYLAESVQKGDFLSEYTGEVISSQEAERRGIIYDRKFLSFLFDLNKDYVIDAARLGNNTRFINHADNEKDGLNCEAKITLVNGEHRIKFVALRDIEVGEELLFNYGKKFAEKHGLSKKLPKAKGKKGVLIGEEALDALDGVDQRKKSARVKVAATRGRPRGSRGRGSKMRKTAPAREPIVEEPVVESQEDDLYAVSQEAEGEDDNEDEDEEDDDEEPVLEGRRKRKITRPARYTR
ncbi:hypothetical protein EG329_004234 [Mollisiaceae sp. DMI_Dod_QoI]|nr:hypothetical protein EG329_004234 [Helotiales sp. DMI_Dod_QoI]